MQEENFGTQASVHLIEGVRLIWGPLNTGFTVLVSLACADFTVSSISVPVYIRISTYHTSE